MYPRTEYEMSESDEAELLDACKPVPYLVVGGMAPASPQENANRAWAQLGQKMGFDHMTVRPVHGKGTRFFTAVPSETAEARDARLQREAKAKKQQEIESLSAEIAAKQKRLDELKGLSRE